MLEQKALAYANMYGVLGALENLCALDDKAKEIIKGINKPVFICFDVKEGPCRTFHFDKNGCKITEGSAGCSCKMNFSSPEKFNALINDSKPGVPVKGVVTLLKFLTGPFTALTNRLTEILRPNEEAMSDRAFFEENTLMLVYVTAYSGSYRFGVNSVSLDGGSFCIYVEQTNDPEVGTQDMAGWFITVAVPDSTVAGCTGFDAVLKA